MHAYKKFALLLVIAVSYGGLSASAYRANVKLSAMQTEHRPEIILSQAIPLNQKSANAVDPYTISFSPFSTQTTANQTDRALRQEASELRSRLGFMVFTQERTETQQTLQNVLQQQINRAPFTSGYWRDLIFVQQGLSISDDEYESVFLIAKTLSRWNVQQRGVLINRCVNEHQKLMQISPDLCADLFANLPLANDVRRLSNLVGVDYSTLLAFLKQLGLQVSGDPE